MQSLRCRVFRGLPKELEEELNKFLETTACQVVQVVQSESENHITLTVLYELIHHEID